MSNHPILFIILGVLLQIYGLDRFIDMCIDAWWLHCRICFKKDIEQISYNFSFIPWLISFCIPTGVVLMIIGIKYL